ncbi:MAG: uncharacterized protein QOH21_1709 [Acidobacteriota bacterium]|jgi:predicted enzyme related to lactoylglutathione lyase|nr:uncharacterized protein [Acidobacteriota bacterium]
MPNTTTFAPGMFNWVELATTDEHSAVEFYTQLFGWSSDASAMGPDEFYYMLKKDGRDVGALYKRNQSEIPPNWLVYVTVANADTAAARARELGATVIAEPFDVMEVGRMVLIQDPQGAMLALWQPKAHAGFGITDEPNTPCWFELNARDIDAAKKFYTALFGWTMKESAEYTEWYHGGKAIGGALPSPAPPEVPSFWMHYIMADDCDATVTEAESLGGKAIVPPTDIPNVGRFAVLADRQGATFAIVKMEH